MSNRLRAPSEDGGILAVPPLDRAAELTLANRAALAESTVRIGGRTLAELRHEARQETQTDPTIPLIVTGHQPELFHVGVWAKNFTAAGIARRTHGQALNLIVDSDTLKTTTLRVPHPDGKLQSIAFDRWNGESPWEDRRVLEPETFARFGPSVLAALPYRPLLADLWDNLAADVLREGRTFGDAFSRARQTAEHRLGVVNREIPLSRLWSLPSFARLAGVILADLPRFHAVYNGAVQAYRAAHGITSRAHPVPDLEVRDGLHEAPFWIRRAGGRRERLFPDGTFPRPESADFIPEWCALGERGIRVRSRALTTTLAARLLLADLFVHGLGGGLYDALTDEILREFFAVAPPPFLILTATCRLPLPYDADASVECKRLARLTRDLQYNPQRHSGDAAFASLRAARDGLVAAVPTTAIDRRERFLGIRRLNDQLQASVAGKLAETRQEWARWEKRRQVAATLSRRDFSFVLFPEAQLRPFLTKLAEFDILTR